MCHMTCQLCNHGQTNRSPKPAMTPETRARTVIESPIECDDSPMCECESAIICLPVMVDTIAAAIRAAIAFDRADSAEKARSLRDGDEHPAYVVGQHWLSLAYERICAGESEEQVLADNGWRRDATLWCDEHGHL